MFERIKRELSLVVLVAGIILATVIFGVRMQYATGVYYLLAVVQIAVIGASAWMLGASAVWNGAEEQKKLAVAGVLLIAPWILFSMVPGLGTPWQATAAENQIRYIVLLTSAIAVSGGMVVLRESLASAGESLFSALGFAAILLASPLYLVWASILFEANFAIAHGVSAPLPPAVKFITDFSDVLLYFGGLLTYLASAAFALSLSKVGWLGRVASGIFVGLSLLAVLFLIIRGPQFPNPSTALDYWYNIPGFVAGIPAIPWFIPCFTGVALLRFTGKERRLAVG